MDKINNVFTDKQLKTQYVITDLYNESNFQIKKWGIQTHTLPVWLMYTTEELGELSNAISEYCHRNGTLQNIYKEAIQTATLSLKIAEMVSHVNNIK